jgi:hypothetical protein
MMERFQRWQVRGGTETGFYSVLNSIFALGLKKVQRWQLWVFVAQVGFKRPQ